MSIDSSHQNFSDGFEDVVIGALIWLWCLILSLLFSSFFSHSCSVFIYFLFFVFASPFFILFPWLLKLACFLLLLDLLTFSY